MDIAPSAHNERPGDAGPVRNLVAAWGLTGHFSRCQLSGYGIRDTGVKFRARHRLHTAKRLHSKAQGRRDTAKPWFAAHPGWWKPEHIPYAEGVTHRR